MKRGYLVWAWKLSPVIPAHWQAKVGGSFEAYISKKEYPGQVDTSRVKWNSLNEQESMFFNDHFYSPTSLMPATCRRTGTICHRRTYEPCPEELRKINTGMWWKLKGLKPKRCTRRSARFRGAESSEATSCQQGEPAKVWQCVWAAAVTDVVSTFCDSFWVLNPVQTTLEA